jgi:DNA repair exonuclease SbcCD ATPase subunit
MIRRLRLKNWRNYADLDVQLEAGTTFVVAPNGIGKTSLVEAAAWALFGNAGSQPIGAVRAGASEAAAGIDVELPDEGILTVTRRLPKRPRGSLPAPDVRLNGEQMNSGDLETILERAYAADPSFLARMTMPRGPIDADAPSSLGLQDHLCHFFGVDGLQAAVGLLDEQLKDTARQIRAAKQAAPVGAKQLEALNARVAATSEAAEHAAATHDEASQRLQEAQEAVRAREALSKWQSAQDSYRAALETIRSQAAAVVGDLASSGNVADALDTEDAELRQQLEDVRVRLGENAGRSGALLASRETLDTTQGDCPVCRRPLDETSLQFAHAAHDADLRALRAEAAELRSLEQELVARHARLRELQQKLRQVPQPGPAPSMGELTPEATPDSVEVLSILVSESLDRLVAARTDHGTASAQLADAQSNEKAAAELLRLFTHEATLRIAREAAASTVRELLDGTIRPLRSELDARWKHLFPGRGGVSTEPDGDMTREVDGEALPFASFSTGERMGALILLRLLVLHTATNANFCWFDEPLEHLDPDTRRQVAGLLARASDVGPLRQILVTTYEEPLARRLESRDPERVRLVYVRPRVA